MWVPLAILAALSLGGGFINIPKFLEPLFPLGRRRRARLASERFRWSPASPASCSPTGSMCSRPSIPGRDRRRFHPLYTLIYNKYFVDELYDATVVEPLVDGSRTLLWRTVDAGAIDGTVNGVGKIARAIGGILKLRNPDIIRSYAGLGGGRVHRSS